MPESTPFTIDGVPVFDSLVLVDVTQEDESA